MFYLTEIGYWGGNNVGFGVWFLTGGLVLLIAMVAYILLWVLVARL